jgi:hypothetical protein
MWKEPAVVQSGVISKNMRERTKESQQNKTANVSAEIRNEHLPNANSLEYKAGIAHNIIF